MLKIQFTVQMKRDYPLQKKRGKNMARIETVLEKLAAVFPSKKSTVITRSPAIGRATARVT